MILERHLFEAVFFNYNISFRIYIKKAKVKKHKKNRLKLLINIKITRFIWKVNRLSLYCVYLMRYKKKTVKLGD